MSHIQGSIREQVVIVKLTVEMIFYCLDLEFLGI